MTRNEMNNNAIRTAIGNAVANCTNTISVDELIKLEAFETRNLTEELNEKRKEVEALESLIKECEETKEKQEAQAKAKAKAEEMFLGTLNASGKETLSYLEGLETLAKGEQYTLVKNIESVFRKYSKSCELSITANLAAYVAILVKEEQREVIDLLEQITLKIHKIQCESNIPDERVIGTFNVLFAIQELY